MNNTHPCSIYWDRGAFLEGNYGVYYGTAQVGKVNVHRQGLYYRFCCRCMLTDTAVYRLRVYCAEKQENLGILVPMDGGFGLDTKLPTKRLGEGPLSFCLVPKHEIEKGVFVSVYPEEPFAYISRLKEAYLIKKDEKVGIMLKK